METYVLDRNAEFLGVEPEQLMENAGRSVAEEVKKLGLKRCVVITGPGNNGGDGFVAARYLKCDIVVLKHPKSNLAIKNYRRAKAMGLKIYKYEQSTFDELLKEYDVVIDAIFGVGVRGRIKEPYATIIEKINENANFIVSVDIPSGFKSVPSIKPNITVTFHYKKEGMNESNSGKIVVKDIGIPEEAEKFVGPGEMIYYPIPDKNSHKGMNGKLAVIGGGPYTGAPSLASLSALRCGCDLVYTIVPSSIKDVISGFSPNLIVKGMDGDFLNVSHLPVIEKIMEKVDAVLIGPGIGDEKPAIVAAKRVVEMVYEKDIPLVVDADAIKIFGEMDGNGQTVVTPHAGEFNEMSGIYIGDAVKEAEKIKEFARKKNLTILFKGSVDVITDGERLKFNRIHNQAMTVGGTGDVLAGIAACLLSKGVSPFNSARMAAFINGMAGNMAYMEKSYGLIATDLIDFIPEVLREYLPPG